MRGRLDRALRKPTPILLLLCMLAPTLLRAQDNERSVVASVHEAEPIHPLGDSGFVSHEYADDYADGDADNYVGEYAGDYADGERRRLRDRTFGGLEFLNWWNKGRSLPTLVTGGDPTTTPFSAAGILPAAPTLFGGGDVGDGRQSGGRLTAGIWLNEDESRALMARGYGAEGDQTSFLKTSDGSSILAIPFDDRSAALFGTENALVLAYSGGATPGIDAQGSVAAHASNEVFGGDLVLRTMLRADCNFRLDLLAGYQFTRINDELTLDTSLTRFDIAGDPQFYTSDLFDVENEYHAGQIGLLAECFRGPLTIQMSGRLGLGNMRQRVRIDGDYRIVSGGTSSGPGGVFAQSTPPGGGPSFNFGEYHRDVVVWSPEAQFKAIYSVTPDVSVSVGYTFMYWTHVALAGDQIDRRVNRDVLYGGAFQPGGGANPAFTFRDTDFWVQSVDIGLMVHY